MRSLLCWWQGFAGTWLDPAMWRLHLTPGPMVSMDGHLYDTELHVCVRCGAWRT